jgi:hypothetical protein
VSPETGSVKVVVMQVLVVLVHLVTEVVVVCVVVSVVVSVVVHSHSLPSAVDLIAAGEIPGVSQEAFLPGRFCTITIYHNGSSTSPSAWERNEGVNGSN